MKRAISVTELLNTKKKTFDFSPRFAAAFGNPERRGVWFIFGNTGNGKTRFMLELCKELARFGRGTVNSLEEADSLTIQNAFREAGMIDVARRITLLPAEPIAELSERLSRKKSVDFVVIDSFQYTGLNFKTYQEFKAKHRDKLIIFTSQVEGRQPTGRAACRVRYDADLKIWVEGYRAFSLGRYRGPDEYFTIWDEKAAAYWGDKVDI